jgi:DNA gyrase subunit B
LGQLVERLEGFRDNLARLVGRGFPADALRVALLEGLLDKEALNDRARLQHVAEIIEASGFHAVSTIEDEEHGTGGLSFASKRDGVERRLSMDWDLLTSAEYRALATNQEGIEALRSAAFTLRKGGEESRHETIDEMLETLYAGAKKGLSVQRYKGLGEMNPEQLWETTMDPARRRLLQVRVEDDYAANEIFTVLMGDAVEPRREFIQANALAAKNLDI